MDEIVSLDELRWLLELAKRARPKQIPEIIGDRLLLRGLIERKAGNFCLTARGRIALAKLG